MPAPDRISRTSRKYPTLSGIALATCCKLYSYKHGTDIVVFYGASITGADLIMTDGKSMEHKRVTPDELLLPAASDLASGRDPALARGVELCGSKMTPEAAGALFPYAWLRL